MRSPDTFLSHTRGMVRDAVSPARVMGGQHRSGRDHLQGGWDRAAPVSWGG